jgi:tripartite ATP-independent transporter DctM subunit
MNAVIIVIMVLFFMAIRIPVVFSLLLSSTFYLIFLSDVPMIILAHRMVGSIESFPLIALPLFILAAEFMNRGTITSKIFQFASQCMGHFQGSLGHVNVFASMLFAGMSGSEVADVAGLGKVEVAAMKERGYDAEFSAAVTGASSIVGPIIPPSVLMIIYGSIAEQSVGRLFLGGAIPGILIGLSLMIVIYFISKKRNYSKSPFPGWLMVFKSFLNARPTLMIPVIIMGGIITGVFTPTESAVVAVVYSFILTFVVYRDLKLKEVIPILFEVTLSTGFAVIIIGGAAVFGWMITQENIPVAIRDFILSLTQNKWMVLFMLNVILLAAGCFFAVMSILIIMTPMIIPLAQSLGIDLIHLGVMLVLNLCIGFLSPPFGIGLYVLSDITHLSIEKLSRAMIPFFIPILFVLFLVTYFPSVSMWLPNLLMGVKKF